MTRPLRNLISAVTLAALTGLLVLAATQWTDVFFRFYPSFSRWILGVLAGITSVTSFPLWEPGLCLIVLWGIISLIRSLVTGLETWLKGESDPMPALQALLKRNPEVVILCDEVGCGVVPMEKKERDWRERVGRTCCVLAEQAERVERLFCGIPTVLKGDGPWH